MEWLDPHAIESVWALLRRIMMGTHHQVSRKPLPRYIAELIWAAQSPPLAGRCRVDLAAQSPPLAGR